MGRQVIGQLVHHADDREPIRGNHYRSVMELLIYKPFQQEGERGNDTSVSRPTLPVTRASDVIDYIYYESHTPTPVEMSPRLPKVPIQTSRIAC